MPGPIFYTIILCTIFFSPISASIRINNNSPYQLGVKIYTSEGINYETLLVPSNTISAWKPQQNPFKPTRISPPFTVYFFCPNGNLYGIWENVSSGATITASGSLGSKECTKKQDPNKRDKE